MKCAVVAAAALCAVVATGCSSSGTPAQSSTAATASTVGTASTAAAVGSGAVATRWWGNGAASSGSTIDPANPAAAAAKLKPSRADYCTMLKQTLAAGHSILPGVTATDPALRTVTTAFVTELQRVAPAEVAPAWQVLGKMIITLVSANGDASAVKGVDVAQVRSAVTSVSADAESRCGVSLSAAVH